MRTDNILVASFVSGSLIGCGHMQTTIERETTSTRDSWRREVLPEPVDGRVYDHLEVVTHDAVRTFDDATWTKDDGILKIRRPIGRAGERTDPMLADIALDDVEVVRGTHIETDEKRQVRGQNGWTAAGLLIGVSFVLFFAAAVD